MEEKEITGWVQYPAVFGPSSYIMDFDDAALCAISSIDRSKFIDWCKENGQIIRAVKLVFLDDPQRGGEEGEDGK